MNIIREGAVRRVMVLLYPGYYKQYGQAAYIEAGHIDGLPPAIGEKPKVPLVAVEIMRSVGPIRGNWVVEGYELPDSPGGPYR